MTGLEITIAKTLAPLVSEIIKETKGTLVNAFKKWNAEDFSSKLAMKLSIADKVKTIWSKDKECSLLTIYYPSKIVDEFGLPQTVNSLDDFTEGNFVIQGIVGQGKSMFLRYLYLQELSGNGRKKLPIFIELRTLTQTRNITEHIKEAIENLDLINGIDVFDHLAKSGKIILLLDGFDEIKSELVSDVIAKIEYFCERYNSMPIIITARPSSEIQKSRLFKTLHLAGLSSTDYRGFLKKLGVTKEKSQNIIKAISENSKDIKSLLTTPLMLTLLVMVYESEKEIPSEVPEFFEKLFNTVFSHHDRMKAGFYREHHSGLSERNLQILFETFCFLVIRGRMGRSLSSEKFNEAFDMAKKYSNGITCEVNDFKEDIVKVSCLMLEEGYDMLTFLHKSICEYFSAAYISRVSDSTSQKFYTQTIKNYYEWSEILVYLEKIDSYRFSKFHTIPSIANFIKSFSPTEKMQFSTKDFFEFFSAFEKDINIDFSVEFNDLLGDRYIQSGYSTRNLPNEWPDRISDELIEVIITGISYDMPDALTREEISKMDSGFFINNPTEINSQYSITLSSAKKRYGNKTFHKSFEIFKNKLLKKLEKAHQIVHDEEIKQEIMDIDIFN